MGRSGQPPAGALGRRWQPPSFGSCDGSARTKELFCFLRIYSEGAIYSFLIGKRGKAKVERIDRANRHAVPATYADLGIGQGGAIGGHYNNPRRAYMRAGAALGAIWCYFKGVLR